MNGEDFFSATVCQCTRVAIGPAADAGPAARDATEVAGGGSAAAQSKTAARVCSEGVRTDISTDAAIVGIRQGVAAEQRNAGIGRATQRTRTRAGAGAVGAGRGRRL